MGTFTMRIVLAVSILFFGLANVASAADEALVEGFPEASLTVYPVTYFLTGPREMFEEHRDFCDRLMAAWEQESSVVSEHLGVLLAEKGYDKCHVSEVVFQFPEGDDGRKDRAASFGAFVSEQEIATDYALCIDAICHLEESWQEVYAVLVDAEGRVVWQDIQQRGDPAFDQHMNGGLDKAAVLMCETLTPVLELDQLSPQELSPEKEQALKQMRAEEPPSQDELEAMEHRLAAMKEAGAAATVAVYPPRVQGERIDADSADRIAEALNEAKLCAATATARGPLLQGEGWPSEPKVLWLYANAAKDYVRENPGSTDYVLFADYWMAPSGDVWAVHFVVLDRNGEWVLVDLQNNHHPDFQRIVRTEIEECDELVVARMRARCR